DPPAAASRSCTTSSCRSIAGSSAPSRWPSFAPPLERGLPLPAEAVQKRGDHRQEQAGDGPLPASSGQITPSRSTVLVQGESGTGKELFVQGIHQRPGRAEAPLVVVDCNSIPSDLLEANLFGHAKGAFTGASSARKGLFEVADGGSIFFDEISSVRP